MRKKIKRHRFFLMRPADVLMPIALFVGEMFGPATMRGWLFAEWLAVRLFALFTADSVRMAYGTQPGMRQVKGSTTLALLMQFVGTGLVAGLHTLVFQGITPVSLSLIGIGLVLNIEHVFYEYINAEGDRYSATICSILASGMLVTGIMLEQEGAPLITLALSGLSSLISLLVAVVACGYRPYRMNSGVIRHIPRALIYGMAYPVLFSVILFGTKTAMECSSLIETIGITERIWMENGLRCGFFAGFAIVALYRTPFRRSNAECRTMWPVLIMITVFCAAASAASCILPVMPRNFAWGVIPFSAGIVLAVAVIAILWGNLKKEI